MVTHTTVLMRLVSVPVVWDMRSKHCAYCQLYMLNTNGPSSLGYNVFFSSPQPNVTRASADGAPPFFFTIRTIAQARRLCNIVLTLVVLFLHTDVPYVCMADVTRLFFLLPSWSPIYFAILTFMLCWVYGVIWNNREKVMLS